MSKNIKAMVSHPWWIELKKILENKKNEIEKEILAQSKKTHPDINVITKKWATVEAYDELLFTVEELTIQEEELKAL